jgi:GntR family transcriptional regulator
MVVPTLALDRDAEVPVGVQLAWILRARIARGELQSGDRLPGARELAATVGVNANTVRSVYARLEEEGLIEAQHGRGTFVAAGAPRERVSEAVARAIDAAREAGIDPRQLAAALYVQPSEPTARSKGAGERRRLRDEIASLERRLAQLDVPAAVEHPDAATSKPRGTRLLSTEELTEIRDRLVAQVAAAEQEDTVRRAAAERRLDEARHEAATATGTHAGRQRWELERGLGRWTIPLGEG